VSIHDRVIRAMEPGRRHGVVELMEKLDEDYAKTFFSLERLQEFGFVYSVEDSCYSLTSTGVKLRNILAG
jgi:DNA-binding IclR family transcriptional regulator